MVRIFDCFQFLINIYNIYYHMIFYESNSHLMHEELGWMICVICMWLAGGVFFYDSFAW
jgi:hypothetical protein